MLPFLLGVLCSCQLPAVITTAPPGPEILVDGVSRGPGPLPLDVLTPGDHLLTVEDGCYLPFQRALHVDLSALEDVEIPLTPRVALVDVTAVDAHGQPVEATVQLEGVPLGPAPGTFRVPVCSQGLGVQSSHGSAWQPLTGLQEGSHSQLQLAVTPVAPLASQPVTLFGNVEQERTQVDAVRAPESGSRETGAASRLPRPVAMAVTGGVAGAFVGSLLVGAAVFAAGGLVAALSFVPALGTPWRVGGLLTMIAGVGVAMLALPAMGAMGVLRASRYWDTETEQGVVDVAGGLLDLVRLIFSPLSCF